MFELFFGLMWTAITAIVTFGFYGTNGDVYVNDTPVSHETFSAMLWPKLFFGLFWVVGFFMIGKGLFGIIRKTLRKNLINTKGEECFGRVQNVYNPGIYVNEKPGLKADILMYIPSIQDTQTSSKTIGFDKDQYPIGSYVKLKYYNGDINIEGPIDEFELPSDVKHQFEEIPMPDSFGQDTIIVDGVEYVRMDSIY